MTKHTKEELEKKFQENLLLMQDKNLHDLAFVRLSEQNMKISQMLSEIRRSENNQTDIFN